MNIAGYANKTIYYMYDGTQWRFISWDYDANDTYSTISETNIKNSNNTTAGLITGQRFSQGFNSLLTSSAITTALGYTPYNSTNPSGFIATNAYRANGEGSDITISDGVIDLVPLKSNGAIVVGSGMSISTYGIKVASAGIYKITGSVYLNAPAAAYACGVYIKKSTNSAAYASSSELGGVLIPKPTTQAFAGAVQFAPNIYSLAANDVIYLAARIRGASDGTVNVTNAMTYLLVEKI